MVQTDLFPLLGAVIIIGALSGAAVMAYLHERAERRRIHWGPEK